MKRPAVAILVMTSISASLNAQAADAGRQTSSVPDVSAKVEFVNGPSKHIVQMWGVHTKSFDKVAYWKSAEEVARVCVPTCTNDAASAKGSQFLVPNIKRIEWIKTSSDERATMLRRVPSEQYLPVKGTVWFRDGTSITGFIVALFSRDADGKTLFLVDEKIKSISFD